MTTTLYTALLVLAFVAMMSLTTPFGAFIAMAMFFFSGVVLIEHVFTSARFTEKSKS